MKTPPVTAIPRLHLLDNLRMVEMLVAVAETNSITRAAQRLGVSASAVSKNLAELEARAKTRLFQRTTRRVSATDVGKLFYEKCLGLMEAADRAAWELRDHARDTGGKLRIGAPVVFAERQIAPLLPAFMQLYPSVQLELVLSARRMEMVEEGLDLSIRLVNKHEIGGAMLALAPNRRVLCAAPAYIERVGAPSHPAELIAHRCLMSTTVNQNSMWPLKSEFGRDNMRIFGSLSSDNAAVIATAAVRGAGIALLGSFVVADDLRAGRLIEIMKGQVRQDSVVAAVLPDRGAVPNRVTLFVDYLRECFGSPPVWDRGL